MSTVVFVGPSVPRGLVRQHFQGEIHPPIRRGDLDALLARPDRPARVGIVDGEFLQSLAATPKEMLRAIDAGVTLYGSASMGALRAVECAPYGMIGVGHIYDLYASGEIDADDEVAMTFDPETLTAISEPMVNIRVAMTIAAESGAIEAATARAAVAVAAALYFPDRSYPQLLRRLRDVVAAAELSRLAAFVSGACLPDQKRTDALEMMRRMVADSHPPEQDDGS
ncbi:TfuA-like protein [Microlunatus panaciterrae]|uniref:TfuA-like core domain-containing protein n=1 Tax=Microlunatus panaciterrae TaxID=400768 RepID=A0ABS2RNA5_9ACTN|nr:TfuA-like protein [Microlunatus panaciterrae]MBM7799429.1 hypothetical protein [Microlunatus panaciterrae]